MLFKKLTGKSEKLSEDLKKLTEELEKSSEEFQVSGWKGKCCQTTVIDCSNGLVCCILITMKNDPWLEKWLALVREKSVGGRVLELGCGCGWDTVDLLSAGCNVIAADISMDNLSECVESPCHAKFLQMDNGNPLSFADHSMAVIVASLSLHYFSWDITLQLASELKRCIQADGLLLARFNSTNDYHFGAASDLEIEPNFYHVGTRTKRFFDEASVHLFLQGWDIQFLEENVIYRYQKPKSVWEAMAINLPLDTSSSPS